MMRTFEQTKCGDVLDLEFGGEYIVVRKNCHYIILDRYQQFDPKRWKLDKQVFNSLGFTFIKYEKGKTRLFDVVPLGSD